MGNTIVAFTGLLFLQFYNYDKAHIIQFWLIRSSVLYKKPSMLVYQILFYIFTSYCFPIAYCIKLYGRSSLALTNYMSRRTIRRAIMAIPGMTTEAKIELADKRIASFNKTMNRMEARVERERLEKLGAK